MSELFGELAARGVGGYGGGALQGDGSGVQAFVHSHYGYARLLLALHDGAFYGGGAAVLREQGGVDVPGAVGGRVEGVRAQDLAESGDDEGVVRRDPVRQLAYAIGLRQRQVLRACEGPDWRGSGLAAASSAAGGLGDHQTHLVGGVEEAAQDGCGELGGPCERYPQSLEIRRSGRADARATRAGLPFATPGPSG